MTNTTSAPAPHTSSKLPTGTHVRVTTRNGGDVSGVLAAQWEGPSYGLYLTVDPVPELGYRGGYLVVIDGERLQDVFVLAEAVAA